MRILSLDKVPQPADLITSKLIRRLDTYLPGLLSGFYLMGSIALNDFHSKKSDIDFIAVCKKRPGNDELEIIRKIHTRIDSTYPKPDLSGYYIAEEDLGSSELERIPALLFHEGHLIQTYPDMAPVLFTEFKRCCICVFGKHIQEYALHVSTEALNIFMHQNINDYWKRWLEEHSRITKRWFILFLFPRFTEWVVLGLARQLCTLQTGSIVSKRKAGEFCLNQLPETFHPILDQAIRIRDDNRSYPFLRSYAIRPSLKRTKATLKCARYIVDAFNTLFEQYDHGKTNIQDLRSG